MSNVREILRRNPPPVLYHYTTQQGLLGIIQDKEIWASHTQYLNDAREFRHALDLVKSELSARVRAGSDERTHKCLLAMQETLTVPMEAVNVCVCSFSERGDVLSQWRAYGGRASGFAVGFSGAALRDVCGDGGWLVPVLYGEDEQRMLVRTLLDDVVEENLKECGEGEPDPSPGNLMPYLLRYAPILKHRSFKEEFEWRIITRPLSCHNQRFGFRAGSSMLIPYFRLALSGQKTLGIREIVVGPTPHPEQSRRSVSSLLQKHDIQTMKLLSEDAVTLSCSEVPFRSW